MKYGLTVRFPKTVLDQIDELTRQRGGSRSALMEEAVERLLEREERTLEQADSPEVGIGAAGEQAGSSTGTA